MESKKLILVNLAVCLAAIIIVAVIIGGRTPIPQTPFANASVGTFHFASQFDPKADLTARHFASVSALNSFIQSNSQNEYNYYGGGFSSLQSEGLVSQQMSKQLGSESVAPSVSDGGTGSVDYSRTNNQVENVDEADMIKTDGEYIYTISGSTVYIVKAYPGEDAKIVSEIRYNGSYPQNVFINGNHLAVFGYYYNADFFNELNIRPTSGMTFFNIYDVSDKESPSLVKEYKLEGRYFDARMTGDYVYYVTASTPDYHADYPTPLIMDAKVSSNVPISDVYYFPISYQNPEFVTVHAIDLKDPSKELNAKTLAVEGSENLYMSEKNIYITYTESINEYELMQDVMLEVIEPKLGKADQELIVKIKATDDEVLSNYEKKMKILQVISSYASYLDESEQKALQNETETLLKERLKQYEYREYTVIHRIGVDNGEISVDAQGKVPGRVINQFSLDEYNDVLRIATTIDPAWSYYFYDDTESPKRTESTNNVFTLDSDLETLDHLGDLAPGEQIYSTRFIGDRLYMVTYRQVDPFFVIDLSKPSDIKELGALKIPGFSRYLHPYDENTIIGIGRDTTTNGRTQGLKISLFDVSDVENPKELAKFVAEGDYSYSNAEYEHKAFLFSKEKQLLVIPAYSSSYDRQDGRTTQNYNGAMVFKITRDEITVKGIIDHSESLGDYWYQPGVERSLYIEDLLYTKSPKLLRINKIDDLSSVKKITFENSESPYPVY